MTFHLREAWRSVASQQTFRFYHGTNAKAAEVIRREGIKPQDPRALVNRLADELGIDRDLLWNAPGVSFTRSTRVGDSAVYITRDRQRAVEYARIGSEMLHDALFSAYDILTTGTPGNVPHNVGGEAHRWVQKYLADAGMYPMVVVLDLPFDFLYEWAFKRGWPNFTYEGLVEMIEEKPNWDFSTIEGSIPSRYVAGVERV